jgi:acyl CoA:acetate/3-ketoacid CoA transferase alpha subunit
MRQDRDRAGGLQQHMADQQVQNSLFIAADIIIVDIESAVSRLDRQKADNTSIVADTEMPDIFRSCLG